MATSVDAALQEIVASLAVLSPQLEGLRDFQRLNLKAETRREIETSLAAYARREQLLVSAQSALEGLLGDGFPEMAVRALDEAAYLDLVANAGTIEAALKQFSAADQATVELITTAGPPEPKN